MTERQSLLILNAIPGLGNIRIRQLLEFFGSAQNVLKATYQQLMAIGALPKNVIHHLKSFKIDEFLKGEEKLLNENGLKFLVLSDSDYPQNLKEIPDPPVLVYLKGDVSSEDHLAIAIVGSRHASLYGLMMAEKLALGLSELGITVVSGMAKGIDTSAHRGALKAHGRTMAVLGSGLLNIYPSENIPLSKEIASHGAILSEYPLTMPPLAGNFPRRNRIVSGLSLGTVVVEATLRSGALITSRFALEQGREVFAVPGKVDNPTAQGTHHLIKQGAKLIGGVEDILTELSVQMKDIIREKKSRVVSREIMPVELTAEEKRIFCLLKNDAQHIDELVMSSQTTTSQILPVLLNLELKKVVKQLPGKMFVRVDH